MPAPKESAARIASITESLLPAASVAGADNEGKLPYFNRELSWLSFNRRVLEQAFSDKNPLLERLKFLSIVSSNLDEFFEIRVAGLIQQVESGNETPGIDGIGPREQLRRIHDVVVSLVEDQYHCWRHEIIPQLRGQEIEFISAGDLTAGERRWVNHYFKEQVYPVLTPLAIDPAHPFPQIGNKTLNILVTLDNPETPEIEALMAILPVPRILPRVVWIDPEKAGVQRYVFLSDVVKLGAGDLFPGYEIHSAHAFRITRNSDLYIDEEEADNLLERIEGELHKRKKGAAVRLEIEDGVHEESLNSLLRHLNLPRDYIFRIDGPINLLRLISVYGMINRPDLKYKSFVPAVRPPFGQQRSLFKALAGNDVLLHHPFDCFSSVLEFIRLAATDPKVFAIKQTLYRTSGDSPIIDALIEASRNGKQVTALVELKARFDEANNIQWAKQLEEAGVHVVYGMVGHKIHCKCCLVVRREGGALRNYVHLGTGNYNPQTAKLYTDLGFFTARAEITEEVAALFNSLTGYGRKPAFRHLLVAPYNLHAGIQNLILNEAKNARAGQPSGIIAKINNLVDPVTIANLYEASSAGVPIDLIVRGNCCLVPGIKGLSENITVRSLVGRFLEHSRIFRFENGVADPIFYLGSADWMPRNFHRRVEVLFPLEDSELRRRVFEEVLQVYLRDSANTRILQPNGAYIPVDSNEDTSPFSAQEHLLAQAEAFRKQMEERE